ncbi:hypothetical protein NC653_030465 [Populus alba x Populus x berolinensis]|uniref:Uncharacterized protein n=1 Tax=Populus alba x Populus x berolinensis TaxID=444605 RepID=A0AAD6LX63_9ROSI|nr:hypothetical protein NC653_030465 [Populus alba x Populus x berolinensis]
MTNEALRCTSQQLCHILVLPAPFGDKVGSSTPGVQSQTHRVESPTQGDVDAKPAEAGPSMVFFPSQYNSKRVG